MRAIALLILQWMPGRVGLSLRKWRYSMIFGHDELTIPENVILNISKGNVEGGRKLRVCPEVKIFATSGKLILGENVFFNFACLISADRSTVSIGDNCLFGNNVTIWSCNHCFESKTQLIIEQGYIAKKVQIGNDVWVGCNVSILPGVTIGDGCVVAAGAVVTGEFPPYSVIGGIPAKIIKKRGK